MWFYSDKKEKKYRKKHNRRGSRVTAGKKQDVKRLLHEKKEECSQFSFQAASEMDFTTYFADEASTLNHFYHQFYHVSLLENSAVFF